MPEESRVLQLLEEALQSGCTPEDVCADAPELLATVRIRLEQCRRLDVYTQELFPTSATPESSEPSPSGEEPDLPTIPSYAIESVLGRGGMGVVYRARDLRLKRPVALKMLLSGAYAARVERARFLREARAIAALRHPNVVQVYDVDEHEGRSYFTMELLEGGSLAERLGGVPRPSAEAAAMAATIAAAVEAAHRAGIIHRDLKPANVLLTCDGAPKVSDFGLAHDSSGDEELALTLSGARIGTPSYMAPEQAAGKRGTIGPAADVYALGAILYEMLTGRPPFHGESAADTERLVISNDPVAPSRLNPRVPRDLETVCLKCLAKEPARRYASAAALAEDLERFGRGEPVAARRAGRAVRAVKWARRQPAAAALGAAAALMARAVSGGAMWWASERAAAAREVADHLALAEQRQREARWGEANAALDRAELRLGGRPMGDLPARLRRVRRDAKLVARLDDIRTNRAKLAHGDMLGNSADSAYEAALREAGFIDGAAGADVVAARIRASNVSRAVADAIYDWLRRPAWLVSGRIAWLEAVARQADPTPDPTGWRQRALDPATWRDAAALEAVAADPAAAEQSPDLQMFVGMRLEMGRLDSLPLLLSVQQAHPDHFGINLQLCRTQRQRKNLVEALRYGQAAAALRPETALSHFELGFTLHEAGRPGDAVAAFRQALRVDPDHGGARVGLARSLAAAGEHEDAAVEFEWGMQEGRSGQGVRVEYARCLEAVGRLYDAAEQYRSAVASLRRVIDRDPDTIWRNKFRNELVEVQASLRTVLLRQGRTDEVLDAWRAEFDASAGTEDRAWAGYAECCLFLGRTDEYRRASGVLLECAEASADPRVWEVAARTCLLLPPSDPELRRASALIDRALDAGRAAPNGRSPAPLAAKGLAEYRAGRYEAAVAVMEGEAAGALEPLPQIVTAMARWRLGQPAEARRALARAVVSLDWGPANTHVADQWTYHALRREAEEMVLPDLAAYLDGGYQPGGAAERLAMTGACRFRELHAAEARLWADAHAADAALAAPGRVYAVRAATLAGCGRGNDAAALSDADRARFRAQAREWFQAELAAASNADGSRQSEAKAKATLSAWRSSPDLSGVRNAASLARLPASERQEWTLLWQRAARAVAGQ